jgi:signal-transduction protein with cAMP-binding, CBS, and nucleotidyltransferase domain
LLFSQFWGKWRAPMESTDPISAVLHHKSTELWNTTPDATVFEAIELMAEKDVGALLVMEGDELAGLISEREYTREVILKDKSSRSTPVREIMIAKPVTIDPSDTVEQAMQLMTDRHFRYLPVLSEGKVIGIVSIGDLVKWIISAQGALIGQLQGYIKGSYPA